MAKITILEASKIAGIARSNLYKNYINTGKISVSVGNDGKKYIDTSELLRVFGTLKTEIKDDNQGHEKYTSGHYKDSHEDSGFKELLKEKDARIKLLENWLEEARERELWLQDQLAINTKFIAHKQNEDAPKKRWWQFRGQKTSNKD